MKTLRAVFVAFSALSLAGVGMAGHAGAQTAAKAAAKVAQTRLAAASMQATNGGGWACAAEGSYEIAPVSSDVESASTPYVLVHMNRGEPVSSERISAADLAALKKLGCRINDRSLEGGTFVGG